MIASLSSRAMGLVARGFAILGSAKLCYACNKRVGRFLPYRGGWKDVPPLIKALDVIGSDVENHSCPRCGAHDRERHLLMYFDRAGDPGRPPELAEPADIEELPRRSVGLAPVEFQRAAESDDSRDRARKIRDALVLAASDVDQRQAVG